MPKLKPKKIIMKEKEKEKVVEKPEREKNTHFQSVKGMHDILPKDGEWWKMVLNIGNEISELHDFNFIETPILEPLGIFEAGLGTTTDVVEKQMYVFKTRGGESIVLRPEGTASVMRSYLEHHLGYYSSPLKVYYYGPMFRYEKPQAGRYRQFHQWGFEIIGDGDPFYDAQIILVTLNFLKALGVKEMTIKINTVGCRVCRPNYRKKLLNFYKSRKKELCADCARRYEKNPLRLLDCKEEKCIEIKKEVPSILDCLCQGCNMHFRGVLELLEDNSINYEPDPHLVRGLDYYSRTVFEIFSNTDNKQALAGGGRYDYLSEFLGGRIIPSVGSSIGIERIIEFLESQKIYPKIKKKPIIFFVVVGEQAKKSSVSLINKLRISGIHVIEAISKQSFGGQLKSANKAGVSFSLILGQKEHFEGTVIIRDMSSGVQETILSEKIVEEVKKRLK